MGNSQTEEGLSRAGLFQMARQFVLAQQPLAEGLPHCPRQHQVCHEQAGILPKVFSDHTSVGGAVRSRQRPCSLSVTLRDAGQAQACRAGWTTKHTFQGSPVRSTNIH